MAAPIPFQDEMLHFGLKAAGVVAAIAIGVAVLRIARRHFSAILAQKSYSDLTIRTSSLALQWFGWIVIAMVVLLIAGARIGLTSGPLSLILGVLILATVAGWHVAANFVCGLILVNSQPFGVGDDVEILEPSGVQGPLGRVTTFNYLYTTLQQIDPNHGRTVDVKVPNSQFFTRSFRRDPGTNTTPLRVGK